jgi:hypothetical protein
VVLALLWTLAAVGTWWLLQAGAHTLEAQPAGVAQQAVIGWTERPWVRYWLAPDEVEALRDGLDWLFGLGGGPAAWLGSTLTLLGAALLLVWAGGLLLGAAGILIAWVVTRRALAWWGSRSRANWASRPDATSATEAGAAG